MATDKVLDHLVLGYPRLAGHMGIYPERAVFRRFGALNYRNLLYLQSELAYIERKLIKQEQIDSEVPEKKRYALDWYWLSLSQDGDTRQLDLVNKMRMTLKEYSKSLPSKMIGHAHQNI
jgi:hypothetical protein